MADGTASAISPEHSHEHEVWPDKVARAGYIAKGVVYITVGVLAVLLAFGEGGEAGGSKNAIVALMSMTFGYAMVLVLTIGLACYALWRWLQVFVDPEGRASGDAKGWARRLVYAVSAVLYTALTVWAVSLLAGDARSGQSGGATKWSSEVMAMDWGRWLIALIGIGVIIGGIMEVGKVIKQSFTDRLKLQHVSEKARKGIKVFGSVGLTARAVVFWIIGGSLIYAAYTANPQQAESFGTALSGLRSQPYGWWLFTIVSIGVVAYGAFQIAKGLLRRVQA
jgi:hypothetical protein